MRCADIWLPPGGGGRDRVRADGADRQVARDLGLAEATVRTHLQDVYAALGVNNRVAAVAAAFGNAEPGVFTG